MKTTLMVIFFSSVLCASPAAFSQTVRVPVTAAYLGLGAYSNNHVDVFSFHNNQAALARLKVTCVGIYGEQRFFLKELSHYNAAIALPTHSGSFALDARYYGFADYNETQLGLGYGRTLGNKIDVGIQFNYYSVRIADYGNAATFNFELGVVAHLTDRLNGGLHIYNPVGGTLGKSEEEKLPFLYSGGFGFEASEKFFISAELEKIEDQPVNVNVGLQYKFLEQLMTRMGVSSASPSMYFGVSLKLKSFRIDATASYHQQLGVTPGLLLVVLLSKKQSS